jgi:hypothetical protein
MKRFRPARHEPDRDTPAQPRIACLVNLAHAAAPDGLHDVIRPELGVGIEKHHFYNETERRGDYGCGGWLVQAASAPWSLDFKSKFEKAQPARVTLV